MSNSKPMVMQLLKWALILMLWGLLVSIYFGAAYPFVLKFMPPVMAIVVVYGIVAVISFMGGVFWSWYKNRELRGARLRRKVSDLMRKAGQIKYSTSFWKQVPAKEGMLMETRVSVERHFRGDFKHDDYILKLTVESGESHGRIKKFFLTGEKRWGIDHSELIAVTINNKYVPHLDTAEEQKEIDDILRAIHMPRLEAAVVKIEALRRDNEPFVTEYKDF